MSRQAKQMLAAQARKAAESDSFVPTLLLSNLEIDKCAPAQFLEIVSHMDEFCANRAMDQRPAYVEQVYHRLLHLLSRKVVIQSERVVATVKQFVTYHPAMSILTLDDLKDIQVETEKRSVIIHFDMSGSMSGSGFAPLRKTVTTLSAHLCNQGVQVHISLFGGKAQESVHEAIGGRLLTLDEFTRGDYQPTGGTAFCPSFERTRQFPTAYDAIIISDGEFTDDISRLTFQENCKTVFFVAPPWSPLGIEQKHTKTISSCVHSNVPYVGIASEKYPQLDRIIEEFLREHHSFARLPGFVSVGAYSIPTCLLAPTQMVQVFQNCFAQVDTQLQAFAKKIVGLFRYLEETAKLDFERCIRGEEFRSLMSLATPLSKCAQAHMETSEACQQLYGYLANILNHFSHQQQKLIQSLSNDLKAKNEVSKLWDAATSFSERELIIDENDRKYGPPIGCLNLHINSLTCTVEMLSEALQQLKTLYAPENLDLLALVLDLLAMSKIDDGSATVTKELHILIWRKADGTVDLMSILRQLPVCLQQLQHSRGIEQDSMWTLQRLAAIRLAWLMDASGQLLPEFIAQALPALVVSNRFLIDLDQDENRSAFWMKIIRQLAPKIDATSDTLESIHQILTAHALKAFLLRVTDGSITY